MTPITSNGLTKRFGDIDAVRAIDFEVRSGEIFGFLGPNGAGKSTTLNLLLGFLEPTAGTASVFGHDPWTETRKVREQVGVLPEGYSLYDRLTAREHLQLSVELRGCDADPATILDRVGLTDTADRKVGNYSKGMRQRLALGTAIVGSPDLLILDEPSSGLDPNGIREMRHIVREERDRGATVVLSSHIMQEVKTVCDRVGIIRDGEFVAVDTLDGLRQRTNSRETLVISVDNVPDFHHLEDVDGVTDVVENGSSLRVTYDNPAGKSRVLSRIQQTGATITDVDVEKTSLEELFAEYTIGDRNRQGGAV